MDERIEFKYRSLDERGRVKVGLRRKARFDGRTLVLGKEEFSGACLKAAHHEKGRLILLIESRPGELEARGFEINPRVVMETVQRFNRMLSARDAEARRQALSAAGRAAEFRVETCPQCRCTVDLSCLPRTPQAYCPYCDVMWHVDDTTAPEDRHYRVCGHCGYFARPRTFTSAYILFALVFVAWQTQKSQRCHNCMRREAWRMLLINAVTLVGVPLAAGQLVRAYWGGTKRSLRYGDLDRANRLAKRGSIEEADRLYDELEQRLGVCAGVRYDHGLAFYERGAAQWEEAATHFLAALGDCANYPLAFNALRQCYESLGRHDELRELLDVWNIDLASMSRPAPPPARAA